MSYLRIEHVTKKFDDFVAVNDVSFEAKAGEFVTLLGPSGCGKTTLLKSIGGFFEDLSSGTISIDGTIVNSVPPEKRNTAMCFQSYALFPHLTVFKNVSFGLEQKKVAKEEINSRVAQVLQQVDILTQIAKLPSELSGGQQQRVALARAMAVRSGVILFDEPLSNLDAKLRERVRFEIQSLQQEMQFTAVYVTHDQQEALQLSDKILVMNKGKIEQEADPRTMYNNPLNRFVADFIGTANIMKARVLSHEKNVYHIETPLGSFEILPEETARKPESKHVYVGWRPENIVLKDRTSIKHNHNIVEACAQQIAFRGNCVYILAKAYGNSASNEEKIRFYIETSQSFDVKHGDVFYFEILPHKIFFLESYEEKML